MSISGIFSLYIWSLYLRPLMCVQTLQNCFQSTRNDVKSWDVQRAEVPEVFILPRHHSTDHRCLHSWLLHHHLLHRCHSWGREKTAASYSLCQGGIQLHSLINLTPLQDRHAWGAPDASRKQWHIPRNAALLHSAPVWPHQQDPLGTDTPTPRSFLSVILIFTF